MSTAAEDKMRGQLRRERSVLVVAIAAACAVLVLAVVGCAVRSVTDRHPSAEVASPRDKGEGMKTIYLAGGCFWGVEKYVGLVRGVTATEVGYANGHTEAPTYEQVCTGKTGYAETVKVVYDPQVAPLGFLLDLYYDAVDPTSVNKQGNDIGTQYRTGVYYVDDEDRAVIERSLAELQTHYDKPIAIEVGPLTSYAAAEGYHQDYLDKNPGGYCHIPRRLFEAAAAARP